MNVVVQTERLILRDFTKDDLQALCEVDDDPWVMRYLGDGRATPHEEIRDRVLPLFLRCSEDGTGFGYWAAIEKQTQQFVGWFQFRPSPNDASEIELGFRLKASAWNKGYATEAGKALIRRGFSELSVQRVVAIAAVENRASVRVLEKLGFSFEAVVADKRCGIRETAKYTLARTDCQGT